MPESPPAKTHPLTKSLLLTDQAALALGKLAAADLWQYGLALFFVTAEGLVEMPPIFEIQADLLPEDQAITALAARGYTQDQLVHYLKSRDLRRQLAGGG